MIVIGDWGYINQKPIMIMEKRAQRRGVGVVR
jgi:hypothetical protein